MPKVHSVLHPAQINQTCLVLAEIMCKAPPRTWILSGGVDSFTWRSSDPPEWSNQPPVLPKMSGATSKICCNCPNVNWRPGESARVTSLRAYPKLLTSHNTLWNGTGTWKATTMHCTQQTLRSKYIQERLIASLAWLISKPSCVPDTHHIHHICSVPSDNLDAFCTNHRPFPISML